MDIMMAEFSVLSCRQSDASRKKDTRRCVKPNSETKQTPYQLLWGVAILFCHVACFKFKKERTLT